MAVGAYARRLMEDGTDVARCATLPLVRFVLAFYSAELIRVTHTRTTRNHALTIARERNVRTSLESAANFYGKRKIGTTNACEVYLLW